MKTKKVTSHVLINYVSPSDMKSKFQIFFECLGNRVQILLIFAFKFSACCYFGVKGMVAANFKKDQLRNRNQRCLVWNTGIN